MKKCEQCGGAYANGYTRCPECAPTDAETQAQEDAQPFVDTPVLAAKRKAFDAPTQENLDALIAAVRAECAAKVRDVVEGMREEVRTGLSQFDGQTMCCDDCAHKLLNHLMAKLEAQP